MYPTNELLQGRRPDEPETEVMLARLVASAADSYFDEDMFTGSVHPGMRSFALALWAYRAHIKAKRP